jgi:hypothetical protein
MHGLRVGLYGDSFGTGSLPMINDNYDIGINYHWSKLLEQHYSCKITNYAVSGASVYYCYRQFMDTHHLHDINIFLITSPGRYSHEVEIKSQKHRIVNVSHLESYFSPNIILSEEEKNSLNEVRIWFKLLDTDQDVDMCDLMIEKVVNTRPDTIFVPCLDWTPSTMVPTDNHLFSIYQHQMKSLNAQNMQENTKWISGHFTPEYNKVFADILISRIENGTWDDWVIPNIVFGSNKDEYFISTT